MPFTLPIIHVTIAVCTLPMEESESKNNPPLAEDHVASDAVVNLDPAASCPTDAIPYGHATRGHISSLKPTIFPANALRLHLDGPSTQPTTLHPPSSTPNPDFRPGRVHFRSRVRITSGFSRHRRKSDTGSSRSCSSSSSTSAPLRSHPHDNTTTWGTLGQRVGLLALQRKILGSPKLRPRHTQGTTVPTENVNERTPLRNSFDYLPYVEGGGVQGDVFGEDSDDERSSHEMDDIFGTYPLRLLNPRVSRLLC
jgi:hypothetical protein